MVEHNDIFARHRLAINNRLKVKQIPKDASLVYPQSSPIPINLEEDLTVDFAIIHRDGNFTTLPISTLASMKTKWLIASFC